MVRMLVLSDKLNVEKISPEMLAEGNADFYNWSHYPNIPRLSDYEIAVLDMEIAKSNPYKGPFLGLRKEAKTLLESGGVLTCLNYFTASTRRETYFHRDDQHPAVIKTGDWIRREINYDWIFDNGLLSALNVAQLDARIGKNLALTSKDKAFVEYFKGVTEYHKTIDSIYSKEDEEGNFLGYVLDTPSDDFDTKIIAVAKVTKKPIACAINIFKGVLIFLPQSNADPMTIIAQLYTIGKSEYEKNIEKIEERPLAPEWLVNYKTTQELGLERDIEDLTRKLGQRELEHKRFQKIDVLLYGTGTLLEDAVQMVLEEMGCTVERMEKSATIDVKAKMGSMKFAIEVTGVDDKIYKKSNKFGQILQYLPYAEEDEKIVLLANTYRDKDLTEREGKEDFTKPVLRMAENNHFCLMTTKDLYSMWRGFLNDKPPKDMFAEVFSTKGEFRYAKS